MGPFVVEQRLDMTSAELLRFALQRPKSSCRAQFRREHQRLNMNALLNLHFDHADILQHLQDMNAAELDTLAFGVIGFDAQTLVCQYNTSESRMAGLSPQRVLGQPLFTAVAPCMNNFMVAQRFHDAAAEDGPLDVTLDYVFTLRMRPAKVKLRLLAAPGAAVRYVLVHRPS
jgi:photoactive yellow protein